MLRIGQPVIHRRRGDELVGAIHEATLFELSARGYAALTVEGVAERAGVGKASIYRRWPGKTELVLEAMDAAMPDFTHVPDTGAIRGDLIALLRIVAKAFNGAAGGAMRAFEDGADELLQEIKERVVEPRREVLIEIMTRAVDRGEIRSDATKPRIADVGPMLLHAELIKEGKISERFVVLLVDEILLPMLRPL